MIAVIDVEIQASNPCMPLYPWRAFKNSPSSLRIRNVPKKIGTWNITSVDVQVEYPNNQVLRESAKLVGGVWVCTIGGSNISGRTTNGYTVIASGVDEFGASITDYILGKGDIHILESDSTISSSNNKYSVKLLSSETDLELVGDAYIADDKLYIIDYDGVQKTIGEIPENLSVKLNENNLIYLSYLISTCTYHRIDSLDELRGFEMADTNNPDFNIERFVHERFKLLTSDTCLYECASLEGIRLTDKFIRMYNSTSDVAEKVKWVMYFNIFAGFDELLLYRMYQFIFHDECLNIEKMIDYFE